MQDGGKIVKTVIEEKDKIMTEVIKESPADKKSTGTRIILSQDSIILQKL